MMQDGEILVARDGADHIRFPGFEHVGVQARTRAGKGVSITIPNCFNWRWGSLVVLDIKREAFNATAGHRYSRLHQDVYLFDPTARDGRSHRWNPFDVLQRQSMDLYDQISWQAFMLFPEVENAQGSMRFWQDVSRKAFVAVTMLLAETPGEPLTIANVLRVLSRGDYHEYLAGLIERSRASGPRYSETAVLGISDFLAGHPETVASVRTNISTTLAIFANPRVAAATETSDFDLAQLRRKPMSIYIGISPRNIPRMRPLLRLFFDQLISVNADVTPEQDATLTVPGLVILDEFRRLGLVTALAEAAQFIAGYGIRLLYVMQNKAQIRELYGSNGATDIFDNLGCDVVFGLGDIHLAKELQDRLGDRTERYDTSSKPKFMSWANPSRQSTSEHYMARPLMYDQEIVQMDPRLMLILRPGEKPAQKERIIWHDDPAFKDLVCDPPEIPRLRLKHKLDDGTIAIPASRGPRTEMQPPPEEPP